MRKFGEDMAAGYLQAIACRCQVIRDVLQHGYP
jgi:hypothetical protein